MIFQNLISDEIIKHFGGKINILPYLDNHFDVILTKNNHWVGVMVSVDYIIIGSSYKLGINDPELIPKTIARLETVLSISRPFRKC